MPDRDLIWKIPKKAIAVGRDLKEAPLALGSFIAVSRSQPSHEGDGSPKRQRQLLVTATYPQDRLRGPVENFEDSGERLRRIALPRVALSAQDNVGRVEILDAIECDFRKRFSEDFKVGSHPFEGASKFARAGSLTIDCIVD